jgi:tRNA(adenine34) deaminase
MMKDELYFMKLAYEYAERAYRQEEVPVGSVVTLGDDVIGIGYNSVIENSDPTAHAEIMAMRDAGRKTGNYRLIGTDMYVTLEPCIMCYAAMVHARIKNLFFGTYDNKTGVFSTGKYDQIKNIFNHTITVKSGIMEQDTSHLLQEFFQERRGARAAEWGGLENR